MNPDYVQIMKMMGNVHCFAIFLHLSHERHSLEDLVEKTGYSPTNISYHIKRLRDKGLIDGDRVGHQVRYRLVNDHRVRRFVRDIAGVFSNADRVAA